MPNTQRPLSADESRKIAEQSGLELIDGAFVRYSGIGEWQDVGTALTFRGCKAVIDENTRQVIELVSPGAPTQLPTHRWVAYDALVDHEKRTVKREHILIIAGREMCRVPFSTKTLDEKTLGLVLALRTGTLRYVSAEEMKQLWPDEWEARKTEIAHDAPTRPNEDLAEMFDRLMNNRRTTLEAEAASRKK